MLRKISPALRLAIYYLIFSGIWILISDSIVQKIAGDDIILLHKLQNIKGLFFVLLCSIVLYFIARTLYKNLSLSLHKSEEVLNRYKALREATREGIADHDLINDCAIINDQMKLLLMEPLNVIDDFSLQNEKRIHPDDLKRVTKNFKDTLATDSTIWQADYRFLLYDGQYHDVINRGIILRDKDNKPVRFISALQDVTELRNMKSVFYEQQIKHKLLLGQSIIKAQENERNRWAEELHDNVCQVLTVVKLYLDELSSGQSFSFALVKKTKDMTTKALNDIRQLSASIKPPEFSITTLHQAIEQLLANVNRVKPYHFKLDINHFDENELSNEQKLMIYRVVQEQLNNIIKYAAASLISIGIRTGEQNVSVEIIDDGKGFDPSRIESGIGLRNIRSRLQVYAGNLSIDSSPGRGCTLTASFSLD